ncbi:hypothetical protein [Micromonospora fluostatini]|uniref:hypothetical protein n=1 Tax=Micromonospora sp. JCM 30529 TaxID=3421643 RepID=UPI003D16385E
MAQQSGGTGRRPERPGGIALDGVMLTAALIALGGYLLPWFKQSPRYQWWYSGWEYASLSTGGGWTLWTFAWILLAVVVSFWAGDSVPAAMTGVVAGVGTLVFSLAVVAASFGAVGERSALNPVAGMPFGIGLPVLATGAGLLLAAGCRAIVRAERP